MIHKFDVFLTGIQLSKQDIISLIVPYFAFFNWYYLFSFGVLSFIVNETTQTFSAYNSIFNLIVFSTILLSHSFIQKTNKASMIFGWFTSSFVGVVLVFFAPTVALKLVCYLFLGVAFGIGLLSFFVFFWDLTALEERARIAGLVGAVTLPFFTFVLFMMSQLNFLQTIIVCAILSVGTITNIVSKKNRVIAIKKDIKSDQSIDRVEPEKRTVLLYTIPWVIFSLVNVTFSNTISFRISQYVPSSLLLLLVIVQIIGGGIGAITGGVIADFFGRKVSLVLGLTLYGLSLAISGLAKDYALFYLSHFGIGLTWGIFLTMYTFVIWGDFADYETSARRYSIGLSIYYFSMSVEALFSPQFFQSDLLVASIAGCLLIFLSNIPLFLAPELLSSSFRRRIDLNLYLRRIRGKKL